MIIIQVGMAASSNPPQNPYNPPTGNIVDVHMWP